MESSVAFNMNSVGIPGGFRGEAGFSGKLGFGVVSGDLGPRKAFAQITTCHFWSYVAACLPTAMSRNKKGRLKQFWKLPHTLRAC